MKKKSNISKNKKKRQLKKANKRNMKNIYREENLDSQFDIETEKVIQMTNKNGKKKELQYKNEVSKREKKKLKRKKRIKLVAKLLFFIGIIIGTISFALISPIFNIKEINVINNQLISTETVISLSELRLNENIFKFYKNDVIKKIRENAYIEDVKVKRIIPNTIEIDIQERVPKYSVDFMGKYIYINSQGYLLEISEDSKGLTIIHGISTNEEDVTVGRRLNSEDLLGIEDVMKIMSSAKENDIEDRVTSIDINNRNDYIIYMNEIGKKVHLGNASNLSNKMLYVLAIIEQEEGREGEIFVNGDLNNKFQPYFREKV